MPHAARQALVALVLDLTSCALPTASAPGLATHASAERLDAP